MARTVAKIKLSSADSKTFNELIAEFDAYNIARGLRQGTLNFYKAYHRTHRNHIKRLKGYEDDFPLSIYTDSLIIELIADMKSRGCKPGGINTAMRYLSTLTKFAAGKGYLNKIPKIIKVKQDKEVGETYLPWEIELMLLKPNMRKTDFVSYRNWVLVCFFLSTGARLSSVTNILIKDVNLEKRTVRLTHTKNRQGQLLPLTPKLVSILNEYLQIRKGQPQDNLFCDYAGNPLTAHAIQQAIEQHNRSRGVKKHGIHTFRRTFATQAIKLGMGAFELQSLLGHSTIEMTSRYVKAAELDLPLSVTRFNPLEHYEISREKSIFINK